MTEVQNARRGWRGWLWWSVAALLSIGGVGCGEAVSTNEATKEAATEGSRGNDAGVGDTSARVEPTVESGGRDEAPNVAEPVREPVVPQEPTGEPAPEPTPEPAKPDAGGEPAPERRVPPEPIPERPSQVEDYSKPGPLATKTLAPASVTLPASTGCSGGLCKVTVEVTVPTGGQGSRQAPYPLVIFSNGFLLKANQYKSYATRMASWGYVVVRWDTNGESFLNTLKHDALAKMLRALIDWVAAQHKDSGSPLKGLLQAEQVVAAGHSRGGKVSALAAQSDSRIKVLFGIDPVDSNGPGRSGPSAVKGMGQTNAPLAVVGADKGGQGIQACAPKADNYEKFYNAAKSPAWELLLKDVGHMQFLDNRSACLTCLACTAGAAPDTEVRAITQTALVAWAEKVLRNVDITAYLTGAWAQSWQQKGRLQSRNK